MDIRGELQLASRRICTSESLSDEEAILCRRIKYLTKERDELVTEERELEMAMKQRKEAGKNCVKARVKSILNHPTPKNIATELTPLSTLEKRKRDVSASLTILGRQLVTLDQQIIDQREETLEAELEKEQFEEQSQKKIESVDESLCQITVQLIH